MGGIVVSAALWISTGFLGPSVVTLTLGPRESWLPPWSLSGAEPSEWLVSLMTWAAIAVGAVGLLIGMRALAAGWLPSVRRITLTGVGMVTATIMVPPMTSADVLMYAAYGRLQLIGRNPYEITPAEIFRSQFDPVLTWTERPWWDTPSVYGPITSWTQWAANVLGGTNMHDVVFWLQVSCALPFVLAGLGVIWIARKADPARQARAALLTVANPLLIWAVVAGAHNEAIAVMFAVGGMIFLRRYPFLAGLGIGIAGGAKLSIGLWGLGMLWAYRRQPKKMILICVGAAIPLALAYVVWEPNAFFQVLRNGGYISVGSWGHPLFLLLGRVLPDATAKLVVGVLSYALLVLIAFALSRALPWTPAPGIEPGVEPKSDPLTIALRTSMLLGVAWLVTAMYTLSWYDLQFWMPLALLAGGKLDRLMVLRGAVLSASYVPGRSVEFGAALVATSARIRDTLSPLVQVAVMVAILLWWKWPDRHQLWPVLPRHRRATAPERPDDPKPSEAPEEQPS